ncbi:MAG: hypothetical protein HY908_20585 [Myxococcales bacterium]|nr:hypothetical protein [Myxococcales bacterium]
MSTRLHLLWITATAYLAIGAACGQDEAGGLCIKGDTRACLGPGQCDGAQTCRADASGWSTCDCGGSGASGGGTTGSTTTTSTSSTTSTTTSTTSTSTLACDTVAISDTLCDPTLAAECGCLGCHVQCTDSGNNAVSDCVCPSCDTDAWCTSHCSNDGLCDPVNEGCGCTDCSSHPICQG